MDKIEWCRQFNSGNSGLDTENRKLLGLINDLIEIRNSETDDLQSLSSIVSQIQHCAVGHFKHEEDYMRRISGEDFTDHKKHHDLFRNGLQLFCFGMYCDRNKTFLNDFCEFLSKWFVFHVTNLNEQIAELYHEEEIAEMYHKVAPEQ